jgi:hypothetical protein
MRTVVCAFACGVAACGAGRGEPRDEECSAGSHEQAIVGGGSDERYLRSSPSDRDGVVLLHEHGASDLSDAPVCTALILPGGIALSARHCGVIPSPALTLPDGTTRRIVRSVAHPALDVTVHALEPRCGAHPAGIPLLSSLDGLRAEQRVLLAGYGVTESGARGALSFVVERLSEVDAATLVADGHGQSGACEGDSGGPMLVRDLDAGGRVAVAGILSFGDGDCLGRDHYVRVDAFSSWLGEVAPRTLEEPAPASDCANIDEEGACFLDGAIWCAGGTPVSERCPEGRSCGWSPVDRGYRCTPDPACVGDERGACTSGAVVACARGTRTVTACAAGCDYDRVTGAARCLD